MSNFNKIIDSFRLKDSLNPKVWENPEDPKKATLKPKIRKALEKISEEFVDDLGDDVFVEDVYLMGSLANFNWSEFSDFDLHVIIDFDRYGKQKDLYVELFDLKKKLFNTKHNIKIYGYDVELYAQGTKDEHHSDGVFSIMNDEWIHRPTKKKLDLNMSVLKDKIKCWTDKIDDGIENAKKTKETEPLKKLKDKLKDYRQAGLNKDGEFSYENLVFKYLRRSGHIEKLFDEKTKIKDKELSIERLVKEDVNDVDPKEAVSQSKFLTDLMKLVDQNISFESTPGTKPESDENLKKIQTALQFGGFLLPEYGVDGKFGPETEDAVKKFQEKYQLSTTGKLDPIDLKHLIALLITKKFKDSDLGNILLKSGISAIKGKYNTPSNFRDVIEIITNELEGGYYHPDMKEKNPSKFAIMGKSGETMFGMDREHGKQENTSAGKEFWSLIDAQNASNNWDYGYMLQDNPGLRDKLTDLIVQIEKPYFDDLSDRYLSEEAKSIIMSDPKLYFNFVYATYNGSGWFQNFATKFNKKIEEGERDVEVLRNYVLQMRKESSNQLMRRSGEKIEKIFDSIP